MGQTWTLLEIRVITCIACFLQILVATRVEIAHPHLGVFKASSLWGAPTWDSISVLEFFYQAGSPDQSPEAPLGQPGAGVPSRGREAALLRGAGWARCQPRADARRSGSQGIPVLPSSCFPTARPGPGTSDPKRGAVPLRAQTLWGHPERSRDTPACRCHRAGERKDRL